MLQLESGTGKFSWYRFSCHRYNGKEFSEELGLYDYGARWYDPAVARFTRVDPLADKFAGYSPYNYVLGNPISMIDPDGRAPERWPPTWSSFKSGLGKVRDYALGALNSISTNMTMGATPRGDPNTIENPDAYEAGQTGGDVASIAIGMAEVKLGGGMIATGGTATVTTAGTSAPASVPLILGGAAVITHGGATTATALQNLMAGDGSKTGSGRGKNNRTADPDAVGDHTVINENGSTTYHSNPKNPNTGFETGKRVDTKGASHKNKNGTEVPTPHVHEKGKDVRPAKKGKDY